MKKAILLAAMLLALLATAALHAWNQAGGLGPGIGWLLEQTK